MSTIWMLEEGDPNPKLVAEYSLPPKAALVAYVEQKYRNNLNTWEYPEQLEGMRESSTLADHWYYDLFKTRGDKINAVVAAYPSETPLNIKAKGCYGSGSYACLNHCTNCDEVTA